MTGDPFSGTWLFDPGRSRLSTPAPLEWTQYIHASESNLVVHEEITSKDGGLTFVAVTAAFDGHEYPVEGSRAADAIAYTRPEFRTIIGTGTRNGSVSLRETMTVGADFQTLTVTYSILAGAREVATGSAVFHRSGTGTA